MPRFHFTRHRPPWWPENEPWPPIGRMRHSPFFRRLGCFLISFNLIGLAILILIVAALARWIGLIDFPLDPSQWIAPIGVALIVTVVAILVAGIFVLRRMFLPLDDLFDAADRISEGDYSAHVDEKGTREVRRLARTFNNMASRLHVADEQRRNLLADVTHELRTPLTVIQGNLEGMLDGVYPADKPNLRALMDETNLLARLIEDLRTLALAESGALTLKKESIDVAMLIRESLTAFHAQAESAAVAFSVEAADDLPALRIDPARMRQVFSNLIANALHYTPPGGLITIRCRMVDRRAIFEVQDSGSGIPAQDLPHVFDRFYKSTDSGGMGLGLAITKHLIGAHGGTITAQSPPGKGTSMRIVLPLE
jgi:two-component system OmpR family sensor kinase/two-component system sensor histidine kinase BaeS